MAGLKQSTSKKHRRSTSQSFRQKAHIPPTTHGQNLSRVTPAARYLAIALTSGNAYQTAKAIIAHGIAIQSHPCSQPYPWKERHPVHASSRPQLQHHARHCCAPIRKTSRPCPEPQRHMRLPQREPQLHPRALQRQRCPHPRPRAPRPSLRPRRLTSSPTSTSCSSAYSRRLLSRPQPHPYPHSLPPKGLLRSNMLRPPPTTSVSRYKRHDAQ